MNAGENKNGSELKLKDGSRVSFSVLPDRITAFTPFFIFTRKIWEFRFPSLLDKAAVPDEILRIALGAACEAESLRDLRVLLKYDAARALRRYFAASEALSAETAFPGRAAGELSGKPLTTEEFQRMEAIIKAYAAVLEKEGRETLEKYQGGFYPISHLPHPKEKIRRALRTAIAHTTDMKMAENLRGCERFLDQFIDDAQARKRNARAKENGGGVL